MAPPENPEDYVLASCFLDSMQPIQNHRPHCKEIIHLFQSQIGVGMAWKQILIICNSMFQCRSGYV